jgi:hypothetical protein
MAKIEVRVEDFRDGALPRVCVATGARADRLYAMKASYKPSWPIVFILLGPVGWLVMLVAAVGLQRSVDGYLPWSDAVQTSAAASRRRSTRHALEALAIGAVLVAALIVAGHGFVAFVAGAVAVVAVGAFAIMASRPAGSVGVRLDRNSTFVVVSDAAPDFVESYWRQEQLRLDTRRDQWNHRV